MRFMPVNIHEKDTRRNKKGGKSLEISKRDSPPHLIDGMIICPPAQDRGNGNGPQNSGDEQMANVAMAEEDDEKISIWQSIEQECRE